MAGTENNAGGANFFKHLKELRSRLLKSLAAALIACFAAYNFTDPIIEFLAAPLKNALPGQKLIFIGLQSPFFVKIKAAVWAGLTVSSPFWLYQFWAFVGPGLHAREKKKVVTFAAAAFLLFLAGLAAAYYFVLPITFQFFLDQAGAMMAPLPAVEPYFSLTLTLLLSFGFIFQMPLVLFFLAGLGLVDAAMLRRGRRYAVLIIFIAAAVLTPPDPFSQVLMALPMLALYELSVLAVAKSAAPAEEADAESL